MKTKYLFIVFTILFAAGFIEADKNFHLTNSFYFDNFMLNNLPGGFFYPYFFENYALDTTFLIEESNGFSLVDNPRVYFEGDSYINFNWFYNGFNVNSSLNHGSPAIVFPISGRSQFRLDGESPVNKNAGFYYSLIHSKESFSRIVISSVFSDLGGYAPWGPTMISNHASNRSDLLYSERRKIIDNYFINYILNRKFKSSNLMMTLNFFDIKIQFNDFNIFNNTFTDQSQLFLINSCYRNDFEKGFYEIYAVFNFGKRSHHHAELGYFPQETVKKERYSVLTALNLGISKMNLKLSFLHETEKINPRDYNFSKELQDNDGDGFFTFMEIGKFKANTLNLDSDFPLRFKLLNRLAAAKIFFDLRYSRLKNVEDSFGYNPIYFNQNPYLVINWDGGSSYTNTNIRMNLGFSLELDFSSSVSILSKFFLKYSGLNFDYSENNLNFLSPGYDVGLLLFKNSNPRIFLSYGFIPYDITENVNYFLERNRPAGTIHLWKDMNEDLIYQIGEESGVYGYTGGLFHFLDKNISAPFKKRLLLGISTKISRRYTLNIKGIYKQIKNNFWVKFDRDFGHYENIDHNNIYFFEEPFRDFYLTNSEFEKDPFYAQLLINLLGIERNKWFFSFSFLAHIGMGYTAFGNGPGSNDIGIINESQANPNSWLNGYGRLDGDRAFVAKCYFGFHLHKKLFLGISLKYRDGNPFAFFNVLNKYDQWVIYYQTIKGEDERGVKGGPREDYLADVSLKLNYSLKIFDKEAIISLSFFNILDFGGELSEFVFSGGSRDAMELQIPRSIRLTFSMAF